MSDAFSIDDFDIIDENATPPPTKMSDAMVGIVQLLALFTPAQRLLILSQFDYVTGEKKE